MVPILSEQTGNGAPAPFDLPPRFQQRALTGVGADVPFEQFGRDRFGQGA